MSTRLMWQRAVATGHRWNTVIKSRPLLYAIGSATGKAFVCDIFVQYYAERKKWREMDYPRVLFFSTYGFVWLGIFHYYFYCRWMPRFFESKLLPKIIEQNHVTRGVAMTFTDLFIYSPFI